MVALSDAWQTGAQQISAADRESIANDPLNLLAVDRPTNEQKADGDAATWLPANRAFRCQYVARQIEVKHNYRLWVTQAEHDAMSSVLSGCKDQRIPYAAVPKTTRRAQPQGTVHGGAFCSSGGSTGVSSAGTTLTCKVAKDGRLRWRR